MRRTSRGKQTKKTPDFLKPGVQSAKKAAPCGTAFTFLPSPGLEAAHAAHAAGAAGRHRRFLLRNIGDQGFGGQDHGSN